VHSSESIVPIDSIVSKIKHSSASPYAFTEQGVAMLSSVLKKNPKRHTGKRQAPEAPKPGFLSDDDGRPRQASSE
jgi:hypothetical protein